MLKLDRICVWLMIYCYTTMVLAIDVLKFADEAGVYLLLITGLTDCVLNKKWKNYSLLLAVLGVMFFYVVYSLTAVHFNTMQSVLYGTVLELKPYICVLVMLGMNPRITKGDKQILRGISLVYFLVLLATVPFGYKMMEKVFGHPANVGMTAMVSSLIYLYCSLDDKGRLPRHAFYTVFIVLTTGLACGRSKYYGEFIIIMTMIFFYRPGMLRKMNIKTMAGVIVLSIVVLAAIWQKLSFYFGGLLDPLSSSDRDSMARAALYAGAVLILVDYPLFGTGLASFASFASAHPSYSGVYGMYGLDKVWGISPTFNDFVSDAFYASLAQFGFVGLILFILFWGKIYNYLRVFTRYLTDENRYYFIIGSAIMTVLVIELTTGTTVFMPTGEVSMMLLGVIVARGNRMRREYREIKKEEAETSPGAVENVAARIGIRRRSPSSAIPAKPERIR